MAADMMTMMTVGPKTGGGGALLLSFLFLFDFKYWGVLPLGCSSIGGCLVLGGGSPMGGVLI